MTHLAMWEDDDASWGEHVTDDEYDAAAARAYRKPRTAGSGLAATPAPCR